LKNDFVETKLIPVLKVYRHNYWPIYKLEWIGRDGHISLFDIYWFKNM